MVIRSKGQQPAVNAARQKNLSGNYRLWGPAADSVIAYGRSTQFSAVRHYLGRATAGCPEETFIVSVILQQVTEYIGHSDLAATAWVLASSKADSVTATRALRKRMTFCRSSFVTGWAVGGPAVTVLERCTTSPLSFMY